MFLWKVTMNQLHLLTWNVETEQQLTADCCRNKENKENKEAADHFSLTLQVSLFPHLLQCLFCYTHGEENILFHRGQFEVFLPGELLTLWWLLCMDTSLHLNNERLDWIFKDFTWANTECLLGLIMLKGWFGVWSWVKYIQVGSASRYLSSTSTKPLKGP